MATTVVSIAARVTASSDKGLSLLVEAQAELCMYGNHLLSPEMRNQAKAWDNQEGRKCNSVEETENTDNS
jgi:hypothetical protein